jgi:predicted nucleic acid-binding protein
MIAGVCRSSGCCGVDDADLHLASATLVKIERLLDQVCGTFSILTMDGPAFRRWAQLMHRQSGTLYEDAMIAAIAKVHQLTVVTRNVSDFSRFDVPLLNPFTWGGEPS